jgi:hypothetical protein
MRGVFINTCFDCMSLSYKKIFLTVVAGVGSTTPLVMQHHIIGSVALMVTDSHSHSKNHSPALRVISSRDSSFILRYMISYPLNNE